MPYGGPETQLPRDVNVMLVAIPAPTATDIITANTVDIDIAEVTVSNSTSADINFTLQDNQTSPVKVLDAIIIGANSPVILPFDPPVTMQGGAKWFAQSAGLTGSIRGRRKMAYAVSAGGPPA